MKVRVKFSLTSRETNQKGVNKSNQRYAQKKRVDENEEDVRAHALLTLTNRKQRRLFR